MHKLMEMNQLIDACLEQAVLARRLAPHLLPLELLDRTAAAMVCLAPRLPDAVLQLAMNEVAGQLGIALESTAVMSGHPTRSPIQG